MKQGMETLIIYIFGSLYTVFNRKKNWGLKIEFYRGKRLCNWDLNLGAKDRSFLLSVRLSPLLMNHFISLLGTKIYPSCAYILGCNVSHRIECWFDMARYTLNWNSVSLVTWPWAVYVSRGLLYCLIANLLFKK